jgi:hypothetical protein
MIVQSTLWTANDVKGKDSLERLRGVFTATVGGFPREKTP